MNSNTPVPIAIIGMACRLPGGATNPDKLWKMLSEGRSGWSEVPPDRWNHDAFYNRDPEAKESMISKSGYFLQEDISAFDARFFGIAPLEASAMDPQQRLLLETTYEALEDAGIPLERLRGSDTSVFVAAFGRDYERMAFQDIQQSNKSQMTGTGDAIMANRISYFLDIHGSSLTLDTGCSGSLVAVHLGCQSLRLGESRMAIVGGAEILIFPDQSVSMSSVGIMNPDGRCYVFDSRGDGYARGEGVSAVILKSLDQALADGDQVHAVILNSGANQDGKTGGITLPSSEAQASLIKSVYANARLNPAETLYVEAHGTGTKAGDKAEVCSISSVFCDGIKRESDLYIGSLKSNIGHLEACSGLAGLLKSVLILKNGAIPPNIDFKEPKTSLKLQEKKNLKIVLDLRPLAPPGYQGPLRVSVNSFGYGGTNAHVILESLTSIISSSSLKVEGISNGSHLISPKMVKDNLRFTLSNGLSNKAIPRIFVLSAFSEKSLLRAAANLQEWIFKHQPDEQTLQNMSYTLALHRSHLSWRFSIVASTAEELTSELTRVDSLKSKVGSFAHVAFVFTGQGAQWHGMGSELISDSKVFEHSIIKSDKLLNSFGSAWSLIEELSKDEKQTRLGEAEISQPATTAIQIALVDFYENLNIKPSRVIGHSSGEIAAAYAAGALSHEAAIEIAYQRGLCSAMAKKVNAVAGSMIAVGIGEKEALPFMKQITKGLVTIACMNSPNSTTISGDEIAIDELKKVLDENSVFNRKLKVDNAYHSHHMMKVAPSYLASCEHVTAGLPHAGVSFFSSVFGSRKTTNFGPEYWTKNLTSRVRFSEALQCLIAEVTATVSSSDSVIFIEIGPHSTLAGPLRQTLKHAASVSLKYEYLSALIRDKSASHTALSVVAKLFELGSTINLEAINSFDSSQNMALLPNLPSYSWDCGNFWLESRLSRDRRFREFPYHDLCGVKDVMSNLDEPRWRYHVNIDVLPWIKDHVVDGFIIFPGSGYVCMVMEAVKQLIQMRKTPGTVSKFVFRNILFLKSLIVPEHAEEGRKPEVELQLTLSPARNYEGSRWEFFRIFSYGNDGTWNEHCSGLCAVDMVSKPDEVEGTREADLEEAAKLAFLQEITASCTKEYDPKNFYEDMKNSGNSYGPNFAILDKVFYGDFKGFTKMKLPDIRASMPYGSMQPHTMHPTTLDAITHFGGVLFKLFITDSPTVPVNVKEISISADITSKPGDELFMAIKQEMESDRSALSDLCVYQKGANGKLKTVVTLSGSQLRAIGEPHTDHKDVPFHEQVAFQMAWDTDAQFLTEEIFLRRTSNIDKCSFLYANGATPVETASMSYDDMAAATLIGAEKLACILLRNALRRIDAEKIEVTIPHMVKQLAWIRKWCSSLEFHRLIAQVGGTEQERALLSTAHDRGVEWEIGTHVGNSLPEILSGKQDPLALFVESDWSAFYKSGAFQINYTQMAEYIRLLAFKKPHMRILEIGAGSGATTIHLLRALTRDDGVQFDKYSYTDISPLFFVQARSDFAEWDEYIDYKVLDIDRDPLEQGFTAGEYDIVVCINVLHATKVMDATMKNIRKLFKPGGKLMLIEITRSTAALQLVFGCLSGWWAFEDGREDSPLLSSEQWNDLCLSNGFSGLQLCCPDHNAPTKRTMMMVAEAVDVDSVRNDQSAKIKLLRGCDTPAVNELVSALIPSVVSCIDYSEVSWDDFKVHPDSVYVVVDTTEHPLLYDPTPEVFGRIHTLYTTSTKILWISLQESEGPCPKALKGLVRGFSRSLRRENLEQKLITIDVQNPWKDISSIDLINSLLQIATACFWPGSEAHRSNENEFGYLDGRIVIPRLQKDNKFFDWTNRVLGNDDRLEMTPYHQPSRPLHLKFEAPGILGSLRFVDDDLLQEPLLPHEIEVDTRAYGINFKDVFIALGQLAHHAVMVGEACGVVTRVGEDMVHRYSVGDRVAGINAKPFASKARLKGNLAYKLPDSISFEVGASIPAIYLTAWYCLVNNARLGPGQSILIHAAAGGVGQAAIQLAQYIGATIFATVGSASKSQLLVETYGIPKTHIFSTRSPSFKAGVLRLTNGRGVDVVLNSLSGEMLSDSLEVVAQLGTFVEIGKFDIYKQSNIIMTPFDRGIKFVACDLVLLFDDEHSSILYQCFHEIFRLFESGAFYAVAPVNVFPMEKIEDAFRLIASRKHTGKVVLQCGEDAIVKATLPKLQALQLDRNGTYVIAGGLSDIGRRIAQFFAEKGAGHVVTLSRRTLGNDVRAEFESNIKQAGATLHTVKCDIVNEISVHNAATYCSTLPPVRGIIHCGNVLRDHPFTHMSQEDFNATLGPKVHGTMNLDKAFASSDLEFFVMTSSVASVMGSAGQANYAAGSAFEDGFAHAMKGRSTHTRYISINLGAIKGSDLVVRAAIREEELILKSALFMSFKEMLMVLEYAIGVQGRTDGCVQEILGFNRARIAAGDDSTVLGNPLFSQLPSELIKRDASDDTVKVNLATTITSAKTALEAEKIITEAIVAKIAVFMDKPVEEISIHEPLLNIGLDSLISVELKNWMVRTFRIALQTSEVTGKGSVLELGKTVTARSQLVSDELRATQADEKTKL